MGSVCGASPGGTGRIFFAFSAICAFVEPVTTDRSSTGTDPLSTAGAGRGGVGAAAAAEGSAATAAAVNSTTVCASSASSPILPSACALTVPGGANVRLQRAGHRHLASFAHLFDYVMAGRTVRPCTPRLGRLAPPDPDPASSLSRPGRVPSGPFRGSPVAQGRAACTASGRGGARTPSEGDPPRARGNPRARRCRGRYPRERSRNSQPALPRSERDRWNGLPKTGGGEPGGTSPRA
jgi:hypothetical protein